jgi:hypothetical protein
MRDQSNLVALSARRSSPEGDPGPEQYAGSELPTVALDAVHRGNTNDSPVRALAVKSRAAALGA